ncbi:MAG TPA: pectate lyase [Candidatus Hydrogenedens sp.]|nr:pectate lyase [Candidatus Hydrogenedens sp.]
MNIKTLVLLFFFGIVCHLQCLSYDNLIYLLTAPGWASENGGVTGGGKAQPVTVGTVEEFQSLASSEEPKTILLSGTIGVGLSTKIQIKSNKTIIGLDKALLKGSLYIRDAKNIIIRNLTIEGPGAIDVNGPDCITIDNSTNVWLDHLDIYDGQDGNVDIVNGSNYTTVSWCKFHYTSASTNHKLSTLIGNSDEKVSDKGKLKVTMVYNWWAEGVESRMPRVRFGQVHVVNNLYTSAGNDYCILAGMEADLRIEYNLFINVKEPINLSQKTFTAVSASNNKFVSVTGNTEGKGTAFNPPYKINIIPTEKLEEIIKKYAGATITDIKKLNIP